MMQAHGMEESAKLSGVRSRLALAPGITYLNSGSFGPLARSVADSVASLRSQMAQDPMDFMLRRLPPLLWNARARLANFLSADPHQLLFTANVTEAVNLIAASVRLTTPGEILLSDREYVTMQWCWERAAKRCSLDLRTFSLPTQPSTPDELLLAAEKAMSSRTRLLFISHVVASTGTIIPVREICEIANRRGIVTVIDGAHGPVLTSVNLSEIECNYYVGSGHKWLLAPTGTGFLYFGASAVDSIEPFQISWGCQAQNAGEVAGERDAFGSTPRLRRLECQGTRDLCPWLAVPDAIDFLGTHGFSEVSRRMRELAAYTRSRLSGLSGLVPVTPDHPAMSGGMTSYVFSSRTVPSDLQARLWEKFRIEVGILQQAERTAVRVSTHFFNTEADIDLLAAALVELL